MKAKMTNTMSVRGYVFSHNLQKRVSKKTGEDFISGTLNIATDDTAVNVVPVNFAYVTPTYRNGNANATYQLLESIINGESKTFENAGTNATRVRIDGDIEVNDWITRDGELASPKRMRGGFIHELRPDEAIGNAPVRFEADMLIQTAASRESSDGSEYLELKGFVFNYRNDVLPVTLSSSGKAGMDFFEAQDISPSTPYFGKVWGTIQTNTVVTQAETDASEVGFGAPAVQTSTRTFRSWEVTGANVNLGMDESTITEEELKAALVKRENDLAEVRKRWEERQGNASSNAGFPANTAPAAAAKVAPAKSVADFQF